MGHQLPVAGSPAGFSRWRQRLLHTATEHEADNSECKCTHCRSSNTPVRLTEVGGISPFWKRFRALIGRLLKNLQVLQECNASERSGPSGPPFGPEDRIRATRNECNDMFGKNR